MKRFETIAVAAFAMSAILSASIAYAQAYETDDYGFPLEAAVGSRSASPHRVQSRRRSIAARRQHPGKGFWANQRASRSLQHAQTYSCDLYNYSRGATLVVPEVAKTESENIGRNLEAAKREFATVRAALGGNKEALVALDGIGKHLNKAAETQKSLHEECCKDSPDSGVCAGCCSDITKELDKAVAEHDALMRTLQGQVKTEAKTE